jgi:hypothetical protein
MQDFKAGDRVREIATGDEGTVVEALCPIRCDRIYVLWETGRDKGRELHIFKERLLKLDTGTKIETVSSVQQALDFLISQGYTVSLSR